MWIWTKNLERILPNFRILIHFQKLFDTQLTFCDHCTTYYRYDLVSKENTPSQVSTRISVSHILMSQLTFSEHCMKRKFADCIFIHRCLIHWYGLFIKRISTFWSSLFISMIPQMESQRNLFFHKSPVVYNLWKLDSYIHQPLSAKIPLCCFWCCVNFCSKLFITSLFIIHHRAISQGESGPGGWTFIHKNPHQKCLHSTCPRKSHMTTWAKGS